jgi:hypothetical protein
VARGAPHTSGTRVVLKPRVGLLVELRARAEPRRDAFGEACSRPDRCLGCCHAEAGIGPPRGGGGPIHGPTPGPTLTPAAALRLPLAPPAAPAIVRGARVEVAALGVPHEARQCAIRHGTRKVVERLFEAGRVLQPFEVRVLRLGQAWVVGRVLKARAARRHAVPLEPAAGLQAVAQVGRVRVRVVAARHERVRRGEQLGHSYED